MTRFLFILALSVTIASAQSLQKYHAELTQTNAELELAFTKYKKSLDLEWMDDDAKKKTLAEIDSAQAAWRTWASQEAELLGKINGEGSNQLTHEEAMSSLIQLVEERAHYFVAAVRGFTLPATPSENASLTQPKPGQALRKTLSDAFRPIITSETKVQKPAFVISSLNVMEDWAFLNCIPQNADGSKIDWSKTTHTEIANGDMDELAVALMAKDPSGQWKVIDYGIGASDVWWLGWIEEYGIPQKLLR